MSYPRLIRRVRALLIDSVVVLIILVTCLVIASSLKSYSDILRAIVAFVPMAIYEPVMVSLMGATIGHQIMGIEVKSISTNGKLNIVLSLIRSLTKFIFGLPSLYFVLTSKRHQALHDLISGALVVVTSGVNLPAHEKLQERIEDTTYSYPSKLRRLGVIIFYVFIMFIVLIVLSATLMSSQCFELSRCNSQDSIINLIIGLAWPLALGYLVIAGWRSRLYGCRRVKNA